MIQVTGTLKKDGRYWESPQLRIVPHLEFAGILSMDVQPHELENEVWIQKNGGFAYWDVPREIFDNSSGNAYNFLISKLEDYIIADLKISNPTCAFEKI